MVYWNEKCINLTIIKEATYEYNERENAHR